MLVASHGLGPMDLWLGPFQTLMAWTYGLLRLRSHRPLCGMNLCAPTWRLPFWAVFFDTCGPVWLGPQWTLVFSTPTDLCGSDAQLRSVLS